MSRCSICHNDPCDCLVSKQPPVMPEDLFGSPYHCRKQLRTRKFASPNSPLTSEELDELQNCIESINDLLRSLGSVRNPNNTRQLQLHFFNLRGAVIRAIVLCDLSNVENLETPDAEVTNDFDSSKMDMIKKTGKLVTAGKDFIQLNQVGQTVFILYEKLLSVSSDECDIVEMEPEFLTADQTTRRKLAFNFGEYVSKNFSLINLFFGIPLFRQLKEYIGKEVKAKSGASLFYGTLVESNEGSIQLLNKEGTFNLNIQDICFLEVKNLK